MLEFIVLAEVEPIYFNARTNSPDYHCCDFCDIAPWSVTEESPWYELLGEGLFTCGDCVPLIEMPEVPS